jgi:hypothetical protein
MIFGVPYTRISIASKRNVRYLFNADPSPTRQDIGARTSCSRQFHWRAWSSWSCSGGPVALRAKRPSMKTIVPPSSFPQTGEKPKKSPPGGNERARGIPMGRSTTRLREGQAFRAFQPAAACGQITIDPELRLSCLHCQTTLRAAFTRSTNSSSATCCDGDKLCRLEADSVPWRSPASSRSLCQYAENSGENASMSLPHVLRSFSPLRPLEHSVAICVPYFEARFQSTACSCDNAWTLPMVGTNCPMTRNPVAFSRHPCGPCDQVADLRGLTLSLNDDSIDANATNPRERRA